MSAPRTYAYYRQALAGHTMPLAFVDLELFDQNARDIAARAAGKHVRVASKSVRCVHLLERILASSPVYRGTMAYTAREAVFLSHQGLDDLLVAYPAFHEIEDSGLAEELRRGKRIYLMADCQDHVHRYDRYGKEFNVVVPVCLDLDMSSRFPGLYFGVLRSPMATPDHAVRLARMLRDCKHARLAGLMGYE
ncbi:MAG: amino acid deaminase/aldolase, partial [Candidatus Hydrogenedentes bacterium]|nr:amino acid deaminase/aldolase [Candidatus Hydrogenedentota bacterium]